MENDLIAYLEKHSDPEPDYLQALSRETNTTVLNPRMLTGHIQGRLLSMLSKMLKPDFILEIGTYTGYSALCLAEGLSDNGIIHTIEINDELSEIANRFFIKSGFSHKIVYHSGDALSIIPELNISFDLVFIDGEKREYPAYLQVVKQHIKPGGFLIADNVLWNEKVLIDNSKHDEATKAVNLFNHLLYADTDFEKVMLPIRDGLFLARKKIGTTH